MTQHGNFEKGEVRPFFSVVIPMYNAEKFIKDCILSIQEQDISAHEVEIIIVDDCSTDNSVDVVAHLQQQYDNILLLKHDENKRQGGARNTAYAYARGEYIINLDSDDFWRYTNALSILKVIISETKADMIDNRGSLAVKYDEKYNGVLCKENPVYQYVTSDELMQSNDFEFSPCNCTCKRSLLIEHSIYFAEHVQYEDTDWRIRLTYYAKKIVRTNIPFYAYRCNPSSTLQNPSKRLVYDAVECYNRLYKFVSRDDVRDEARCFISKWILQNVSRFYMLTRNHNLSDSLRATRKMKLYGLLDKKTYDSVCENVIISCREKISLFVLKYSPAVLIVPFRLAMKCKNVIKKILL